MYVGLPVILTLCVIPLILAHETMLHSNETIRWFPQCNAYMEQLPLCIIAHATGIPVILRSGIHICLIVLRLALLLIHFETKRFIPSAHVVHPTHSHAGCVGYIELHVVLIPMASVQN